MSVCVHGGDELGREAVAAARLGKSHNGRVTTLAEVAPQFIEMAHRIVWCAAATVDIHGRPRSRVLHPVWDWDGTTLHGWIATSPESPKAADLRVMPSISLTYWAPDHDTATIECAAAFDPSIEAREALWERFKNAPTPVGYDPGIIPGWDTPASSGFGCLVLEPRSIRVMPGSVLLQGQGQVATWRR